MEKAKKYIIKAQRTEILEHEVYSRLAKQSKYQKNRKILRGIANDHLKHYFYWKKLTQKDFKARRSTVLWYVFLARLFGVSFGLKRMEKCEKRARKVKQMLSKKYASFGEKMVHEHKHEDQLISELKDEYLFYAGSFVLGLNDALVEMSGALAGFTFALQNGKLVAITGLITGVAASLSMAASEYLSSREEEAHSKKSPLKAAFYTGSAYSITVVLLVAPYFLLPLFTAIKVMVGIVILEILAYSYYVSTAKSLSFGKKFLEMAAVSLTVALISFGVGLLLRNTLGISV